MRILHQKPLKGSIRGAVVTIGVFDGVHRGHQKLIGEVLKRARRQKAPSVVITFFPHPVHVLHPRFNCPLISSLEHRLKILSDLGVDICWVIPFRKSFARLPPLEFIHRYLVEPFSPKEVLVGDDFRFGKARRGTLEVFEHAAQKLGFKVKVMPTHRHGPKRFSSSHIRELIEQGSLDEAAELLGRPFSLLGKVIHGDEIGRGLGYPTANVQWQGQLLPPLGIYVTKIEWRNKSYSGVAYVGRRPTVTKAGPLRVEVHIFGFHQNLYNQKIIVQFLKKIRGDKIFTEKESLRLQIKKDEAFARKWLAEHS